MRLAPIDAALLAVAILTAIPAAVFFAECLLALLPGRRAGAAAVPPRGRGVAVLIPAHDEEEGIGGTVRSLRPQLEPVDRIVVVADNCSDATAERARAEGAEAIERRDAARRGKGHALAFGLDHLRSAPPDTVVFVDADTILSPGSLESLRAASASTGRPTQGVYLLDAPPGSGPGTTISAFAFLVKNLVRPLGLARIGVPCPLVGAGMAFPWGALDTVPLATGNIVEDLQMGIDLAIQGRPPLLCPEARISGSLAPSGAAERVQRTRWEHGHLRTLLTQVPRLLAHGIFRFRPRLVAMGLDLSVPPLALLCLTWATATGAAGVRAALGGNRLPLWMFAACGALILFAILAAWAGHGRGRIPFLALAFAPLYALLKLPLYLAFAFRPQQAWVRTPRGPVDPPPGAR